MTVDDEAVSEHRSSWAGGSRRTLLARCWVTAYSQPFSTCARDVRERIVRAARG